MFNNLNNPAVCKIIKCMMVVVVAVGNAAIRILNAGGMDESLPLEKIANMLEASAHKIDEINPS